MVHKKIKSKRLSTAHRAKIHKKSKEQKRKLKKEAKKNPNLRKKIKKDPGIPKGLPFSDKLLKEIEEAKEKAKIEKQRRKENAALKVKSISSMPDIKQLNDLTEMDKMSILSKSASTRSEEFLKDSSGDFSKTSYLNNNSQSFNHQDQENMTSNTNDIGFYRLPDSSRKAYFKEFRKVVELSDVILQVLDARDPLGSRVAEIEEMVLESSTTKKLILILNKVDLIPTENARAWLKYLRNEFPTFPFQCLTKMNEGRRLRFQNSESSHIKGNNNEQEEKLLSSKSTKHSPSEIGDANGLIQLLKNYCRSANIKTAITVGVIGFPNVGKSSLINSLKRSKVCSVGSTPGITKTSQEIYLDSNIKLLDSPGIVFNIGSREATSNENDSLLLRNCLRVEQLEDPMLPVELIFKKCPKEKLLLIYQIASFNDTTEFLSLICKKFGKLKRGGILDLDAAARLILNDWNSGRIPFYSIPPSRSHEQLDAKIVNGWSEEFKLDNYFKDSDSRMMSLMDGSDNENGCNQHYIQLPSAEVSSILDSDDMDIEGDDDDDIDDDDENSDMMEDSPLDISVDANMSNGEKSMNGKSQVFCIGTPLPMMNKKDKLDYPTNESVLNSFEREYNPQINRDQKKKYKKDRKLKSKFERTSGSKSREEINCSNTDVETPSNINNQTLQDRKPFNIRKDFLSLPGTEMEEISD